MRYMHADIDTIERMEILRGLRLGRFDVLVGINLLREGLDLPEVSLVAILDADKEGFLRDVRSLIQTIGRAARNVHGRAILYADHVTESMLRCIEETERRREVQIAFNAVHGITPETVRKSIEEIEFSTRVADARTAPSPRRKPLTRADGDEGTLEARIQELQQDMEAAAAALDFERAALLRDELFELRASAA